MEGFASFAYGVESWWVVWQVLFFTLGPSTGSDKQFTFTCLDVDLSARHFDLLQIHLIKPI
jgi:hypothetical protein